MKKSAGLPPEQRVEIVQAVLESVRNEAQSLGPRCTKHSRKIGRTEPPARFLEFEGGPPTDEDVKDMITDYLIEKYS